MRLLTHNVLNNNSQKAKGNGYPLRLIRVTSIRVDPTTGDGVVVETVTSDNNNNNNNDNSKVEFVKGIIPTLHWPALLQVRYIYTHRRARGHIVCVHSLWLPSVDTHTNTLSFTLTLFSSSSSCIIL